MTNKTFFVVLLFSVLNIRTSRSSAENISITDLPDDCLRKVASSLESQDLAMTSTVSKSFRNLVKDSIASNSDGVMLQDGRWVFVQQAIEQGCDAEICSIQAKAHVKFLHLSFALRNKLLEEIIRESRKSLDSNESIHKKRKTNLADVQQRYFDLGLKSSALIHEKPSEKLAMILVLLEGWDQTICEVFGQIWNHVDGKISRQMWRQISPEGGGYAWHEIWSMVEDQLGSQVRSQIWLSLWNKIGSYSRHHADHLSWDEKVIWAKSQVKNQLRKQIKAQISDKVWLQLTRDLESNFIFHESLDTRSTKNIIEDSISHTFLVYQLSLFAVKQSPEILKVQRELNDFLDVNLEDVKMRSFLQGLVIPHHREAKIGAFLESLRVAI